MRRDEVTPPESPKKNGFQPAAIAVYWNVTFLPIPGWTMDDISKLLAAARGDVPSDVLITGGRVINVFNGEIESVDIAIFGGRIAGIGAGVSGKTNCRREGIVYRSRIYRCACAY